MDTLRRLARILLNILIPLVVIGLIICLLPRVLGFFAPFVVGGIIALIANPMVRFLERKVRLRRKFGTVLIIGGALALVIIGGYAVISRLVRELAGFISDLPSVLESVGDQLELAFTRLGELIPGLPGDLEQTLNDLGDGLVEAIKEFAGSLEPLLWRRPAIWP